MSQSRDRDRTHGDIVGHRIRRCRGGWCFCHCSFGDGIGQIIECLPIGRSGRFKLERKQLRIKGNVIACNDLPVSPPRSFHRHRSLQKGPRIRTLATISVDGTEGSNRWNLTDIGATIKKHLKDGFGTITP
jgi:hypothetical protein